MLFDIAIIGILLFGWTRAVKHGNAFRTYKDELTTSGCGNREEAAFRTVGNIKRFENRHGIYKSIWWSAISPEPIWTMWTCRARTWTQTLSSTLIETNLENTRLNQTNFENSNQDQANLTGSYASGANFKKMLLKICVFDQ